MHKRTRGESAAVFMSWHTETDVGAFVERVGAQWAYHRARFLKAVRDQVSLLTCFTVVAAAMPVIKAPKMSCTPIAMFRAYP